MSNVSALLSRNRTDTSTDIRLKHRVKVKDALEEIARILGCYYIDKPTNSPVKLLRIPEGSLLGLTGVDNLEYVYNVYRGGDSGLVPIPPNGAYHVERVYNIMPLGDTDPIGLWQAFRIQWALSRLENQDKILEEIQ
ncbi:hypothetical protein CMO83_04980 [Candidatus Woesearchaeota archaeon]|jgi:hypothetical protein|nr:hypothetical protein [Candidatus Woesearchaeota archaeon]|tara:strand:- start:1490 stop:1900 length:411 start_codon:yes stop_codon:yes gene_type:complete